MSLFLFPLFFFFSFLSLSPLFFFFFWRRRGGGAGPAGPPPWIRACVFQCIFLQPSPQPKWLSKYLNTYPTNLMSWIGLGPLGHYIGCRVFDEVFNDQPQLKYSRSVQDHGCCIPSLQVQDLACILDWQRDWQWHEYASASGCQTQAWLANCL